MNQYPAIAGIENRSVASGIRCADAMAKQAPISVMKAGTVHNGKYLILIGGSVAAVEEAYQAGLSVTDDYLVDCVLLPDAHDQVRNALLGTRQLCSEESLGILETITVATLIKAVDAGIKGTDVQLLELRLADDLGGKAVAFINGRIEEVEAAISIARSSVKDEQFWFTDQIIPRLNEDVANQLNHSSHFAEIQLQQMQGGEI